MRLHRRVHAPGDLLQGRPRLHFGVSGNVITTTLGNATCPAWLLAANGTGTGAGLLSGMDSNGMKCAADPAAPPCLWRPVRRRARLGTLRWALPLPLAYVRGLHAGGRYTGAFTGTAAGVVTGVTLSPSSFPGCTVTFTVSPLSMAQYNAANSPIAGYILPYKSVSGGCPTAPCTSGGVTTMIAPGASFVASVSASSNAASVAQSCWPVIYALTGGQANGMGGTITLQAVYLVPSPTIGAVPFTAETGTFVVSGNLQSATFTQTIGTNAALNAAIPAGCTYTYGLGSTSAAAASAGRAAAFLLPLLAMALAVVSL